MVYWVQGSNAHVVAEVCAEEILALVHALPPMPWRRARAWCVPNRHLLLHAVTVSTSACVFTAPVSHPLLAGLRSCRLAGSYCPPAVGLEVRLLSQPLNPSVSTPTFLMELSWGTQVMHAAESIMRSAALSDNAGTLCTVALRAGAWPSTVPGRLGVRLHTAVGIGHVFFTGDAGYDMRMAA